MEFNRTCFRPVNQKLNEMHEKFFRDILVRIRKYKRENTRYEHLKKHATPESNQVPPETEFQEEDLKEKHSYPEINRVHPISRLPSPKKKINREVSPYSESVRSYSYCHAFAVW